MAIAVRPPGPKGKPLIGQMQALRADPLGFLTRCARDYGDIVHFKVGSRDFFLINHPDYIKDSPYAARCYEIAYTERMTDNELLDIYIDYLISAFGLTTATGLSALLEGQISHDCIQRFLASEQRTSNDLWTLVKPHIRAIEQADGVLIVDDSIAEKPYADENDIIRRHYDHTTGGMIKGINFLTALYHAGGLSLPVGFTVIAKTEYYIDKKDGKEKRRSPVGKNDSYRTMLQQAVTNRIPFRYVLNDVWFASAENMVFVTQTLQKDFVMPLKANRKVALSAADKQQGRYVRVATLELEPQATKTIYQLIAERRASSDNREDILSLLIDQRPSNHDGDSEAAGMTDQQIRDEAVNLFWAGHKTMASALTWIWYLLAQHQEVEARLHAELNTVLKDRLPTLDDIAQLQFTEMVFAESLRLYPPGWIMTRRPIRPCSVGGYVVPAGSVVLLVRYVTHLDPRFFHGPARFDPMRWTLENRAQRPKYYYFPFGAGPHQCIGEPFAWMQGILILATVAQRWRMYLVPNYLVEPVPFLTLQSRHGMCMQLEARGMIQSL